MYATHQSIGVMYGVSRQAITNIMQRKSDGNIASWSGKKAMDANYVVGEDDNSLEDVEWWPNGVMKPACISSTHSDWFTGIIRMADLKTSDYYHGIHKHDTSWMKTTPSASKKAKRERRTFSSQEAKRRDMERRRVYQQGYRDRHMKI
jgi:hypothetical protein